MPESLFFDGQLSKTTLPLFRGPPPAGVVGPKRLLLPQGELASFYDSAEGIRYIAFLELRVGAVRGNHVHRVKLEHFYLISGELLLRAKTRNGTDVISVKMQPGDLVRIQPGILHVFEPKTEGTAVEFSPTVFDPADIERVSVF